MRVRADRPSYWIGETFDTWDGQSWIAARAGRTARGTAGVGAALLPARARRRRRSGVPRDLQTFYVVQRRTQPRVPRRQRHARCGSRPPTSSSRARRHHPVARRLGPGTIYTVRVRRRHGRTRPAAAAGRPAGRRRRLSGRRAGRQALAAPPPLPPRRQALAEAVTAGAPTTYDKVQALDRLDRRPHPLLHRHPAAGAGPGHGRPVPLRRPRRLLRADLHRPGGDAPLARHPGPRGRRLRARAPTTRSPTSTRSRPRTPTPGCRCGSPATAGRASTRPPSSPRPTPSPGATLAHEPGRRLAPRAPGPGVGRPRGVGPGSRAGGVATPAPAPGPRALTAQLERAARRAGIAAGPERAAPRARRAPGPGSGRRGARVGTRSAGDVARAAERAAYLGVEPDRDERAELRRAARRLAREARSWRGAEDGDSAGQERPAPRRSTPRPRAGAGRP